MHDLEPWCRRTTHLKMLGPMASPHRASRRGRIPACKTFKQNLFRGKLRSSRVRPGDWGGHRRWPWRRLVRTWPSPSGTPRARRGKPWLICRRFGVRAFALRCDVTDEGQRTRHDERGGARTGAYRHPGQQRRELRNRGVREVDGAAMGRDLSRPTRADRFWYRARL